MGGGKARSENFFDVEKKIFFEKLKEHESVISCTSQRPEMRDKKKKAWIQITDAYNADKRIGDERKRDLETLRNLYKNRNARTTSEKPVTLKRRRKSEGEDESSVDTEILDSPRKQGQGKKSVESSVNEESKNVSSTAFQSARKPEKKTSPEESLTTDKENKKKNVETSSKVMSDDTSHSSLKEPASKKQARNPSIPETRAAKKSFADDRGTEQKYDDRVRELKLAILENTLRKEKAAAFVWERRAERLWDKKYGKKK